MNCLPTNTKTLQARIVSGSAIMLTSSALATAANLAYNLVVARFLGPIGFGHAAVVCTLLTLFSAATLSFQIVTTKLVVQQTTPEDQSAVYRAVHRGAWACGLSVGLVLLLFQSEIANFLNLPDSTLVALLAIGAAFYVPLGPRRGYIQGTYRLSSLAVNMVLEGIVRLGGSYLAIVMGFGVRGVIVANAAAIAVVYFAAWPRLAPRIANPVSLRRELHETAQAMIFFAGTVLMNNCDIVLVKHFFPAKMAGLYAAIAMVGRVIYTFSYSVVNSTFPLVAGTREEERKDLKVIATALALVLGVGSVLSTALWVSPAWLWTSLLGPSFQIPSLNISYLLALYAITTVVYSLSVIMITFEMSYKITKTSWVQLAFSGVVIAGICLYHATLREVILVQLVLMAVLFVFVAVPFFVDSLTDPCQPLHPASGRAIRLIRSISEDEVIAEFLRRDFHTAAFQQYQESMRDIVINPDLASASDNAKRRALLFVRHRSLWKEIPLGTEWYEVEIGDEDTTNIRAFPRAQWRKLACGNFSITNILESMRTQGHLIDPLFLSKIASIAEELRGGNEDFGAVILIGVSECEPLTVLDGNHRLAAALFASPSQLGKLRFLCGLSPRMTECCWHNSNLVTLFRYGKNMLTHAWCNPGAELARMLQSTIPPDSIR